MRRYKLVEVTQEEHVALFEAGAWVNWDVNFDPNNAAEWTNPVIVLNQYRVARMGELNPSNAYKFYTRIEEQDDELQ